MNEIILAILPYIGTAIVALAGNFLITKAMKKKQSAEAKESEWKVWKDQLDHAAQKLKEANDANDAIMRKWQELSKMHEDAVADSAEKAIIIAEQRVKISKITTDCSEAKEKAEKYKAENATLIKALEEVPRMKKTMDSMSKRIKELEDKLCIDGGCVSRKK